LTKQYDQAQSACLELIIASFLILLNQKHKFSLRRFPRTAAQADAKTLISFFCAIAPDRFFWYNKGKWHSAENPSGKLVMPHKGGGPFPVNSAKNLRFYER
jgi:hypothetical protein